MSLVPFSDWLHPAIEERYDADRLSMGQPAETIARDHEMARRDADRGPATMCIGFGQGIATVFERV